MIRRAFLASSSRQTWQRLCGLGGGGVGAQLYLIF